MILGYVNKIISLSLSLSFSLMLPSAVPPLVPQSHCTDAYLLEGGWWGIGGGGCFGSVKGFKISPQFFVSKGKEGGLYILETMCI